MFLVVSFSTTYSKASATPQKIVYVVINVDTESINGKYLNSSILHPSMDVALYSSSPPSTFTRVFDPSFRGSISDSFGNSFKMTWFTEMDYLYSQSIFVNGTAPAGISGYTAMLDLLQKNWGSQMQTFGDAIEYHHHFEIYNRVWTEYDDGPDAGYGDYQMYALDHMIIDNGFYPASFRSGWNVMSTPMSNWLEQWFPFDYCPTSGGWSPVHAYPGMNHNQTQTVFWTYQGQVQQAFNEARDHGSSIYSFYMHEGDNMVGNITDLSNNLKALANDQFNYPGVKYEYVTAAQAMQLASGYTDLTPPTFQVSRNGSTYIISSSETLWSNNLYVAVSYTNGSYIHLAASPAGTNTWMANIPSSSSINKTGVAANDLYGNPGVLVLTPATTPQGSIPPTPTVPQTMPPEIQVPVVGVTASSYLSGYSPDKAVDGLDSSLLNYWGTGSSGFPQWLKLDLWSVVPVNRLVTHFFDGDSRNYTYSIDVSSEGSTWTTVVSPKTASGNVTDDFNVVLARYVRLTVLGNTANSATQVKETKVFQPTVVPQPTPSPSPSPSPTPTASPTPSPSPSPTPTASPSPSPSPTPTASPSPSPSPTPTASPSPSPTSTNSSTPTPTVFPSSTPNGSSTPIPSVTASPSPSPLNTSSPSPLVTGEFANNAAIYSIVAAIVIVGAVNAVIFVRKKKAKV
jgi:hypothetical protein